MKSIKRIIAFVLSLIMVITCLPNVFGVNNSLIENTEILYEILESRDQYTKVFKLSNGNNLAYCSLNPLHYLSGQQWIDIDNTLVSEKSTAGDVFYENKDNSFKVSLPSYISDEAITISNNLDLISMKLLNETKNVSGSINKKNNDHAKTTKALDKQAQEKAKLENKISSIKYSEVFTDTDINYDLVSNSLKESIILNKKPQKQYSYKYEIITNGLKAILKENNSIDFVDKNNSVKFSMPSPFMFDSSKEAAFSKDIELSLETENNSNYYLTITPSYEWLTSNDRIYPITIDPTIQQPEVTCNVTYVDSNNPNINYNESSYAYADMQSKYVLAKVYYDWLDDGAQIINANLFMNSFYHVYSCSISNIESSWNPSTVTWNTKPTISSDVIDVCDEIEDGYANWDISSCFNNSASNGFAIKCINNSVRFFSDYSFFYQPYVIIEFINISGINNGYPTHTQDMGEAGTVYINDYTGKLSLLRNDIGVDGLLSPVNITMLYDHTNRYYNTQNAPGSAMNYLQTNYNLPLRQSYYLNRDYDFTFYNESGNIIYFKSLDIYDDNTELERIFYDTNNLGYTLKEKRTIKFGRL